MEENSYFHATESILGGGGESDGRNELLTPSASNLLTRSWIRYRAICTAIHLLNWVSFPYFVGVYYRLFVRLLQC